jgi:hypothetical protein
LKAGNQRPVRYRKGFTGGGRKLEHILGEEAVFVERRKREAEEKRLAILNLREVVAGQP